MFFLLLATFSHASNEENKRFFFNFGPVYWNTYESSLEDSLGVNFKDGPAMHVHIGGGVQITEQLSIEASYGKIPKATYLLPGPTQDTFVDTITRGQSVRFEAQYAVPINDRD